MQKKLKSPDLTRFGFYLFPKIYKDTMGFKKAHGLLFLDARGRVGDSLARELGMTHLLNSSGSVLYAINPVDGRYPNASELLRSMSLGNIARQRLITKSALKKEFESQCEACGIDLSLLDKVNLIGINKDGNPVYESRAGRFLKDEDGNEYRDLPLEKLLYAVDAEGEIDVAQTEYCLESLFKFDLDINENGLTYTDANDFATFVGSVTKKPPVVLPNIGDYTPIPFYKSAVNKIKNSYVSKILDVFERLEGKLLAQVDFESTEEFQNLLQHTFFRALPATDQGYKTTLPAPLVVLLVRLMQFSGVKNPHIVCPYVGGYTMLASMVYLQKQGADVTVCEKFQDKQHDFNEFLADVKADKKMVVHSEVSSVDYHGCITYLSNGDSAPAVLIPNTDHYSYKSSVVEMLDLLERRLPEGRSIFIADTDDEGNLGLLDEDSILLAKYLYKNYQNVVIFDCHKELSTPNRYACEYRVFIIGDKIDDGELQNQEELADLELSPKILTIDSPEAFYSICTEYANEIAAVEISGVDLMDNLLDIVEDEFEESQKQDNTPELESDEENEENEADTAVNQDANDGDNKDDTKDDSDGDVETSNDGLDKDLPADTADVQGESNDTQEHEDSEDEGSDTDSDDSGEKEDGGSGDGLKNEATEQTKAIVLEAVDNSDFDDVLDDISDSDVIDEDELDVVSGHDYKEPLDENSFEFDDASEIESKVNSSGFEMR